MPIETKTLPVPPWRGLFLDGVTVPGGMSRADNVCILPDGSAERRLYQRTLDENPACLASRGLKSVYELRKADGTRYLFADVDNSDTAISSFGSELISHFATWTPTSGWTYGSSIWTHTTGTIALVATGETAIVAASKYRIVVDITQTPPSSSAAGWTYTSTDSGLRWVNKNGNSHIVWMNSWTHAAGGGTTALTTARDFTVIAGQTYRIIVHVTHTAGTSLSVYIGGKLAGTITATGLYEYVVPFVTNATALRFVPTNDWAGSIDKTWPRVPNQNDAWISVQKFINPAGANIPSNIDTGSTHIPISLYDGGRELLYVKPVNWYPEEASQLSQSIAVYLGGTLAGVIQASGEYAYDVTATTTAALTFTPTTSWAGSVNGASVKVSTLGAAATKLKVIGGEVTGTTDYEVSWSNILTNLITGAAVLPAWATMQDRAFRVDGTNINYYFRDASDYHTLGVPAPIEAPVTASSSTTGELVAGTYNVYYTYVKKDGDYIVEGNPSPVSNTVITGTAIDVNVIGNSDSDITHIRIYRTLYKEEGADAYYEREVLNETDTVTITDADDTIGDGIALEYNRDMPKRAMFVMTGGSRLWLLRFPSEVGGDSMMMWSEIGSPEYFPALNYQPFDPDDGDVLMGAAMMQNNILVFKRRRTWICDVYSMQNIGGVSSIAKNILSPTIGCIASGSIQSVGIDQAIWLSAEGIMLYDGGRILNISKDRINTVINHFMANGAEYYIDSVYHSTRRQYHINFVYRTGAAITRQRHFVYSMDVNPDESGIPGAWTEYVYTSDAGVRYYEINFCLASDSNLMEVILIPYLVTTTGTVAYIYQTDYELPPGEIELQREIMSLSEEPVFSASDSSLNVYVATVVPEVHKFTYDGVESTLVSNTAFRAITGFSNIWSITAIRFADDYNNECFYVDCFIEYNYGSTLGQCIIKVTYAGVCSLIAKHSDLDMSMVIEGGKADTDPGRILHLNDDGTVLFYSTIDPVAHRHIHKVVNPNTAPVDSDYYVFPYYSIGSTINGTYNRRGGDVSSIEGNNLYFLSDFDGVYTNWQIVKLKDFAGTADPEIIDTGIATFDYDTIIGNMPLKIMAVSSTKIYVYVAIGIGNTWADGNCELYELSYADSAWSTVKVLSLDNGGHAHTFSLFNDSSGNFILTTYDTLYKYSSNFTLLTSITIGAETLAGLCGASTLHDSVAYERVFIIPGLDSGNVYMVYPDGWWEIITDTISEDDTEPTMRGAIVNIVSNYTDLGIANDKRIKRVYLDTESQYATCGAFTLEPGYNVNIKVHETGETSEPSGATSLRPFAHPGRQDWTYTNDQFDSTSEAWLTTRLDVGVQGKKFRYSIKVGDVPTANHGLLRIRPPMIDVQVKGKGKY